MFCAPISTEHITSTSPAWCPVEPLLQYDILTPEIFCWPRQPAEPATGSSFLSATTEKWWKRVYRIIYLSRGTSRKWLDGQIICEASGARQKVLHGLPEVRCCSPRVGNAAEVDTFGFAVWHLTHQTIIRNCMFAIARSSISDIKDINPSSESLW